MFKFITELKAYNDRVKKLDEEIEKMDKNFSYLMNPSLLPSAYQASIIETSRRREYKDIFDKKFKKLQTFIDVEYERRKKFLANFGRILPCDFIA